jgi:two-component system, chemotaxis family, chemotaxis protein CheY
MIADAPPPKPRILVVDDDQDTRALYSTCFEARGCEVIEAADGRQALTLALLQPPALVVTEIQLPFIDGYALCEILRRDIATTHVPILVVTTEGRRAQLNRAKASGANAVLVKPIDPEHVSEETERLLVGQPLLAGWPVDGPPMVGQPQRRRGALSKSVARIATRTPPVTPPPAVCPSCDRLLTYKHSHLGGISPREREQWDWYVCPGCDDAFEYRHRTRRLRQRVRDGELG